MNYEQLLIRFPYDLGQIQEAIQLERSDWEDCPFANTLELLLSRAEQRCSEKNFQEAERVITVALTSSQNSNRLKR